MGTLTLKEQTLLAYYVFNFIEMKDTADIEVNDVVKEGLQGDYSTVLSELKAEGLADNSREDGQTRITNEGILYIDNTLHIQSESPEDNKLSYVKDSLLINETEFSHKTLKEYIYKQVGIDHFTIN